MYKPIGIVHSPFKDPRGTPIQAVSDKDTEATIEVFEEYAEGLQDLDGFSHAILLLHFHLSKKAELKQKPFLDDRERGVFSIRSPSRPNPIGISVVKIVSIDDNIVTIRGIDILDGTPLLDIKPYVPEFDAIRVERIGWLEGKLEKLSETSDDGRFSR
jgi:tRNA-Thr(GGU) m(6)t(6)A37 methyltransferase TsaA